MKLKLILLAIAACVILAAMPGVAQKLPCSFQWSPSYSDALVVCAPNGTVFDSVWVTEANEDPTAIYTLAIAGPDPNQFGFATTFCEFGVPCGPGLPDFYYSDIFGVASVNGGLFLGFSSDSDQNGSPYGSQGFFFVGPEPVGWYPATLYLDPNLVAQGYTAWFVSSTPEPTTMLLIGSGLALMAGKLRRK